MNNALSGFSAVFEGVSSTSIDPEKILSDSETELDEYGNLRYNEKLESLPADDDDEQQDDDNNEEEEVDEDKTPDEDTDDNEVAADDKTEENQDSDRDEVTSLFFDALAESAGWGDIDEESKPKNPDELIEYFKEVIAENSTPKYHSEEIAMLDEFVKNGGRLEDYIKISSESDYENVDLNNEFIQKKLVSELLSKKGFSEAQIARKIEKYEDAEILEDEAKDAIETLKEIAEQEKKALLEEQNKKRHDAEIEQQKFIDSVMGEIEAMDNIRGIKIPSEDKKALTNYLFNVESDGRTKYQKDYAKSTKNLIESAYFTMKGDSLLNSAKKSGETTATDKFRQAIKTTGLGKSKQPISAGANKPLWSMVSKSLLA